MFSFMTDKALSTKKRCNLPDEAGCAECFRLPVYGAHGSMGLEPWVLNLEGLYISLSGYTRHPFHGEIHLTILLVGLQHCCIESLASSHIIAIIVGTTFLSLVPQEEVTREWPTKHESPRIG